MGLAVGKSMTLPLQRPGSRLAQGLRRFILSPRWLAVASVLILWQSIAMLTASLGLLPTPWRVAVTMWGAIASGAFVTHMSVSMIRLLLGFAFAMLIGMVTGVLMGSRKFWDSFFQDIVVIGLSLPGLIYALLSVVVFGLGLTAPVVAIVLASYPFITVNIREGVKAIDKDLLDMCRAYRVGRWNIVRGVILQSLVPFVLSGIRTGFTIAWKVSVLTEVVGATKGVGYMIHNSFDAFSVRGVIAWALLFGGVMLLIEYGILLPAERYFARWRPTVKQVI